MIAYIDSTGKIIGGTAGQSPEDLKGITYLSGGAYAVFIDEVLYPNVKDDQGEYVIGSIVPSAVYHVPTATGTPVFSQIPDSVKLANAQQSKIQELQTSYSNTLSAGFVSSASATPLTYGFEDADQTNISQELNIVNAGLETFPIQWSIKGGTSTVSLTQAQFLQLCKDSKDFKWAQVNNLRTKVGNVLLATNITAVNLIVW